MKSMVGELGKLSLNNEQVGGFKYWTAIQNKADMNTTIVASQFWMLKEVKIKKLQADFYMNFKDRPKLIHSREVVAEIPAHELDTMTTSPLKMYIENFNWLK